MQNIDKKFGFIILRHVNSEKTNRYWIECYSCIRRIYDNKIVIIDDNSDKTFLNTPFELINCEIVDSEYPKRGELLPYYYFYKNNYFDYAVIIHDSVFIQKFIDFTLHFNDVMFLWNFEHKWNIPVDELYVLESMIKNKNDELYKKLLNFYNKKESWLGCFGVQSLISHEFVSLLNDKYNFFELLNYVNNRNFRMALERIFALICFYEKGNLMQKSAIFGNLHEYTTINGIQTFGYGFDNYMYDKSNNMGICSIKDRFPIIKVWTGR